MGVGENLTQIPQAYLDVKRTLIQKDSLGLSANCVLLIAWQKSFKDSCFKKNASEQENQEQWHPAIGKLCHQQNSSRDLAPELDPAARLVLPTVLRDSYHGAELHMSNILRLNRFQMARLV